MYVIIKEKNMEVYLLWLKIVLYAERNLLKSLHIKVIVLIIVDSSDIARIIKKRVKCVQKLVLHVARNLRQVGVIKNIVAGNV